MRDLIFDEYTSVYGGTGSGKKGGCYASCKGSKSKSKGKKTRKLKKSSKRKYC